MSRRLGISDDEIVALAKNTGVSAVDPASQLAFARALLDAADDEPVDHGADRGASFATGWIPPLTVAVAPYDGHERRKSERREMPASGTFVERDGRAYFKTEASGGWALAKRTGRDRRR